MLQWLFTISQKKVNTVTKCLTLSVHLSICLYICLFVCPFVYLFVHLSICLSICLFVCTFVYLHVFRFGVGYHLTMVKEPLCDVDHVTNVISTLIRGVQKVSDTSSETTFILPFSSTSQFPSLFDYIEGIKQIEIL